MSAAIDLLLQQQDWHEERKRLHAILLDCGLSVAVKWNKLCYTLDGANVAIIYGMKDSCAVGFFKGALLDDPAKILTAPGAHSQAMRRVHFSSLAEIADREGLLRDYTARAIAIERQGLTIQPDAGRTPDRPAELLEIFAAKPELKKAFAQLTPGRQRGYLIHFSAAASPATRHRRIEKYASQILAGKGMHDR